ncbi:hypothetical protein [Curtobacterium sp. TXMA1]|uniref:hypothetical protein n=1 Tax=Curtobacterium sp. TXMA1 TaxID=2876939 RepID=UPI001CCBAB3F|nr:hypothetical protein [Curtobacterium sp. TXMA1]UBQ02530.1 hypothetical protein LCG91_16020 [Curtobacterium sp. TXMA1]
MRLQPATITVTTERQNDLDLRWLRSITVPVGVQVDVVDLGWRCDVTLARGGEHVVVIGDLLTGQRLVQADGAIDSPLVRFALLIFQQRQLSARSVRLSHSGGGGTAIAQIAAAMADAVVLAPGETIADPYDEQGLDGQS